MIDEAQHLGKIPSGRRLLDQLDGVKSIANQTKILASVLLGTYDLLAFRNLNGQLSRRSIDVHLARYHADDSDDQRKHLSMLFGNSSRRNFLEDRPDLVRDWNSYTTRSLGCITTC